MIIDGLIAYSDGNPTPLKEGGVTAANVTICNYHADLQGALKEIARWHGVLSAPGCGWTLIRSASDLSTAAAEGSVGLIMGWQNAKPLEPDVELLRAFHQLGLRVLQLTYNEANAFADGCHERRNGGLTNAGCRLLELMNELGVAVDLSHCSEATGREAAALSKVPVLLTHANANAVNQNARNKSDETLVAIADSGGAIGLSIHGFLNWDGDPNHPPSLEGFTAHVRHVVNVAGVDHVGIGSDLACVMSDRYMNDLLAASRDRYGGVVGDYVRAFGNDLAGRYPKEVANPRCFPVLLDALKKAGFSSSDIEKIAGRNFERVLADIWH